MPRGRTVASLGEIIQATTAPVVVRASSLIARAVVDMVAKTLESEGSRAIRSRGRAAALRSRNDITRWAADRRARRVPTFVIEMTGLETKKKIVAKYGENAAFEKGKPPPPVKAGGIAASSSKAARVVKGKSSKRKTAARNVV